MYSCREHLNSLDTVEDTFGKADNKYFMWSVCLNTPPLCMLKTILLEREKIHQNINQFVNSFQMNYSEGDAVVAAFEELSI